MYYTPTTVKKKSVKLKKIYKQIFDHSPKTSNFSSSKLSVRFSRSRKFSFLSEKCSNFFNFIRFSPVFCKQTRSLANFQHSNLLKNTGFFKFCFSPVFEKRLFSSSKDFGLSRISFRKLAVFGFLPGVAKSSW
jgi:hypothetical protein